MTCKVVLSVSNTRALRPTTEDSRCKPRSVWVYDASFDAMELMICCERRSGGQFPLLLCWVGRLRGLRMDWLVEGASCWSLNAINFSITDLRSPMYNVRA